jgi:pyruvate dehydrogenase E2 component (dihydrolipoamide acetyltransferase)
MIDFLLPSLGADMDRAKLVNWLVAPGDQVHKGQIIAELETDKANLDVECWDEGVIEELVVTPGPERLPVGTLLARIRPIEEGAISPPLEPIAPAPSPEPLLVPLPTFPVGREAPLPPVRHLAHELGVDLATVEGTGADGVVTRDDVRRSASHPAVPVSPRPTAKRVMASPRARMLASRLGVDLESVTARRADHLVVAEDIELAATEARLSRFEPQPEEPVDKGSAMRRAIARSMSHSKREIPHYYLATHIDLGEALAWLEARNEKRSITGRVLPAALLLKATALALRETPDLNGHWIDDRFQPSDAIHLGVAVSLREGGLVAPAIHDADRLDLDEMMARLRDLVNRARAWRLKSSEMSDPTITVTNLGDRGVETAFPVIIPPQVAIVGFGRVVETPVARAGQVVARPTVHATLAGDHRVTDGHRGGLFLDALDRRLQEPESL